MRVLYHNRGVQCPTKATKSQPYRPSVCIIESLYRNSAIVKSFPSQSHTNAHVCRSRRGRVEDHHGSLLQHNSLSPHVRLQTGTPGHVAMGTPRQRLRRPHHVEPVLPDEPRPLVASAAKGRVSGGRWTNYITMTSLLSRPKYHRIAESV